MIERSLSILNESKNLSKVRAVVAEVLEETPFNRETRNKIIVAVDEALANVVEHAYGEERGTVDIRFTLDAERLHVRIRDNGIRFHPGEKLTSEIDIHEHIRKGLKGGLGLFLMRRIMDEVHFNHDGPEFVNELVMVKKVPQAGDDEGR
ncbi:MAG: ATP-binding protein [Planctomycetota bacterium]|nr:MAG: ATP-binding protein [Planctomycetota bacterium]